LGCNCKNIDIDPSGTNPFKDLKTIFQLQQLYKKIKPLVVLHFTPKMCIYSSIACSFQQIPFISNISGLGVVTLDKGFLSKVMKVLYKFSQKKATTIFFQNESDRSTFLSKGIVPAKITDRLPGSGVDLSFFSISKYEENTTIKFFLIARMLYEKGVLEYVEAAKKIKKIYPNAEFFLLGPSAANNPSSITQTTIDLWVRSGYVDYLGSTSNIKKYITYADCIVLPSYYSEGVPRTLLEAGAMGKIVITTNNVGCRDAVDDGVNGFICTPRSVDDLTDKLKKVIKMTHDERILMGLRGREKMEKEFDENIVLDKYKKIIKNIK